LAEVAARTAIAALAAIVANVLVRAAAIALFDIPDAFEHLALRAVVLSTLGGVLAAGLVYALIARRASNPGRTFTIVAVVALVLSLIAPLSVGLQDPPEYPGTDAASVGTLMAMHVVAATIAIATLTRR
jgi:Family of unknown function (DUF6069)